MTRDPICGMSGTKRRPFGLTVTAGLTTFAVSTAGGASLPKSRSPAASTRAQRRRSHLRQASITAQCVPVSCRTHRATVRNAECLWSRTSAGQRRERSSTPARCTRKYGKTSRGVAQHVGWTSNWSAPRPAKKRRSRAARHDTKVLGIRGTGPARPSSGDVADAGRAVGSVDRPSVVALDSIRTEHARCALGGPLLQREQLFTLPPGAFSPPPKVHSSVVRITIRPRLCCRGFPRPSLFSSSNFALGKNGKLSGII